MHNMVLKIVFVIEFWNNGDFVLVMFQYLWDERLDYVIHGISVGYLDLQSRIK